MDKKLITNNFSKNAATYDNYASVQKECANKLISLIRDKRFSRILEIGCGTGLYTGLLHNEYTDADITASDISEDMIKIAKGKFTDKNICFSVIDGEQISSGKKCELITSNASFQWFESFDAALKSFAKMLTEDGTLCFSMYGPDTFRELKKVLKHHFGHRQWLSSSKFVPYKDVGNMLRKYFKKIKLTEEHFTIEFLSLRDFLRDIKHSGTRGEGIPESVFFGRYRMMELEKTYIEKFGRIIATHHVYFCRCHSRGSGNL